MIGRGGLFLQASIKIYIMVEIKPKIGIKNIEFGSTTKIALGELGNPDEVNVTEGYEIWEYYEKSLSLFFDVKSNQLIKIEFEEVEVRLWDKQIMFATPEAVKKIIELNTREKIEIVNKPIPCLMYIIESLGLEFYFESKKLVIISAGISRGMRPS